MSSLGKPAVLAVLALLLVGITSPVHGQGAAGKVYVATYVDVQPNFTSRGLTLIQQYCQSSRAAAGNLMADGFQEIGRSNRFVLIEAWNDQSSFDSHEHAPYTNQFRSALKSIHGSPYDQRVSHGFAIDTGSLESGGDALFVVTHVDVPPPSREDAETLLKRVAEASRMDDGHVRFDVYQQNDPRTNHFTLFAAWRNAKAFEAQHVKPYWVQYREGMAPLLGALYDERFYKSLKP